jgi:beta-glucanase (GH16 family)
MSARRVLAGSVLALLMPASMLAWSESVSATDSRASAAPASSLREAAQQRVSLQALPQIVQQGKRVASANSAKAAITATIKPVKVGRKVKLQMQTGSSWKTVSTVQQDAKGRAQFAAAATRSGLPVTYRVQAEKFAGLKALTSDTVTTEKWLTPDFTDEFSGTTLNAPWWHRGGQYEPQSLRLCSKGDPSAVKVGGGVVRLSVIKDPTKKTLCKARERGEVAGKFAYRLNGHIGTEYKYGFKYGVAAARMKMQALRGQHASFWLQPEGGNLPSSEGHEIDVIEYFGNGHPQGGLTSFIHRYKGNKLIKLGSWIKNSESFLANRRDGWSKSYHVFSVEWTPTTLVFRIDGKETWRISGNISKEVQYPILSLLASDYELSEMKDKQLPQHTYVDWVRIWETGDGGYEPVG